MTHADREAPARSAGTPDDAEIELVLSGLRFRVGPVDALAATERQALMAMGGGLVTGRDGGRAFTVELLDSPPWPDPTGHRYPDRVAASVMVEGDRVRLGHARFLAELEPARGCGRVYRRDPQAGGLEMTLRTALTAVLPSAGGVALHAAGVDLDGAGLVFFGPSGAGKSTLAASCPWPVYSDELVSLAGRPFRVGATGFWGALGAGDDAPRPAPVRALVELAKGPRLELEDLPPRVALRRLLGVTTLPLEAGLWRQALLVLGALVDELPVLRMTWSPDQPPWSVLEERFTTRAPARRA